ncbi:sensor histidine kinase [Paenibacillus sp. GYB003]|uniref:sensor histidine kinase n=1 Tax=Paenibacillus sp. GYB003 TaxID=2994392 RepID=UPI002F960BE2
MELGTPSEQDVFTEELRILKAAKADVAARKQPGRKRYEQLACHYEKLLKMTMKLSRISDIQGRTLKEREQELKSAHAELQHMEELRRQLISDISHELRTPITSVQGYVKAFLDDVIKPDEAYLSMLYHKLLTIDRLITDLFQLSTLKANQQPLYFRSMPLMSWYSSLQGKYELESGKKGIALAFEPAVGTDEGTSLRAETAVLLLDTVKIEQVVTNLIDNALKFTAGGGSIRIGGRLSERPPEAGVLCRFPDERDSPGWFTFTVEDTGEGIDPKDLPFIFERFFRAGDIAKRGVAGAGLGLAISKEIVMRHQGQIGADSVPGRGSRFHFSLPVRDAANIDKTRP